MSYTIPSDKIKVVQTGHICRILPRILITTRIFNPCNRDRFFLVFWSVWHVDPLRVLLRLEVVVVGVVLWWICLMVVVLGLVVFLPWLLLWWWSAGG